MVSSNGRAARPTSRTLRARLAALLAPLWLAGCGASPGDTLLHDYQRKLATALGLPAPQAQAPANIGAFPAPDERLFAVPETRTGLLAVYALRECRITHLVAARNNQLGRVAPPSQRWLYELTLWRRLHACQASEVPTRLNATDRARLARFTRTKRDQLPRVSWNGLFASEEWRDSFSRASAPLAPDAAPALETQLAALRWLEHATRRQLDPAFTPDSATLEGHLDSLRQRPLTAELLRALLLGEQRLREANTLLQARLATPQPCTALSRPGPQLHAAFRQEPAHAWFARLDRLADRWLGAIDRLLDSHPVTPPAAVADYRHRWLSLDNPAAPLPAYRAARASHRQHWQRLAARCP